MKNMKAITKWLLGAAMASAFVLAAPHKADAQAVVSAGFNGYAPVAVGYYGHPRYDGWRRPVYVDHYRWDAARWHHDRWERERFHYDHRNYRRY